MMDSPIELRTARLLLRRYKPDDLDDLFEYANSPEWERYLVNVPYPYTRQVAEKFLAMFTDVATWKQKGILANFAIELERKVVGEVYLNQHEDDRENERTEIGYSISRSYWNMGLTTEAARAVMDWIFQTRSVNRVYAWSDPRNIGSWRVMEKLGMKREGLLRSHTKWDGTFRDRVYYGILREEWQAQFED